MPTSLRRWLTGFDSFRLCKLRGIGGAVGKGMKRRESFLLLAGCTRCARRKFWPGSGCQSSLNWTSQVLSLSGALEMKLHILGSWLGEFKAAGRRLQSRQKFIKLDGLDSESLEAGKEGRKRSHTSGMTYTSGQCIWPWWRLIL